MASSEFENNEVKKTIIVKYIKPMNIKFEGNTLQENDNYPQTPAGSLRVLLSHQRVTRITSFQIGPDKLVKLNISLPSSSADSLGKHPNGLMVEAFLNTGNPEYVSSACFKDVPLG